MAEERRISKRGFISRCAAFAAVVVVLASVSVACGAEKKIEEKPATSQNVAMDAYNLRMQGKADEAKTLLEEAIAQDPNNAAAHYELARTQWHMALGNPKNLEGDFGDALQSIEKAVENDPGNVIYPFFEGHVASMLAYISAMTEDQPGTKENLARACGAFESALKLKPDYPQAMLYLVELYSTYPEDEGGDISKAEEYAGQLEAMDDVLGAKAQSLLSEKDPGFWKGILESNPGNADVLEELGKAYLGADKVDDAVSCFEEAIRINPEKTYLFLDLCRYHTFSAMGAMRSENDELLKTVCTSGDAAVTRYIESEPILPMLAHALGIQYKLTSALGDEEKAQALVDRAETLDPYFSKATGAPNPDLFIPPGEVSQNHGYLMRPF